MSKKLYMLYKHAQSAQYIIISIIFFFLLCLQLEHIARYTKVKTSVSGTAWRTQVLSDDLKDESVLDDLTFQSRTFQTDITQYGHIMLKLHIMYFIRRWKRRKKMEVDKTDKSLILNGKHTGTKAN